MKTKILKILGGNHMTPIQFTKIESYKRFVQDEVYGLYTYKNDVYVFKNFFDIPFDNLTDKEQKKILNMVESKQWELNECLQ